MYVLFVYKFINGCISKSLPNFQFYRLIVIEEQNIYIILCELSTHTNPIFKNIYSNEAMFFSMMKTKLIILFETTKLYDVIQRKDQIPLAHICLIFSAISSTGFCMSSLPSKSPSSRTSPIALSRRA